MIDKLDTVRFFEEILLLTETSIEIVLGMRLLTLSNMDIQFAAKKLVSRTYTIAVTLLTTQMIELINNKDFAKALLKKDIGAFVVYISFFSLTLITIYSAQEVQMFLLLNKKVTRLTKKADFANVLSKKSVELLSKEIDINEHTIKFLNGK